VGLLSPRDLRDHEGYPYMGVPDAHFFLWVPSMSL
jgi:hypothetical protein